MSKGRKGKKNILGKREYSKNEVVPTKQMVAKRITPVKKPLGNTKKAKIQQQMRSPFTPIMDGGKVAQTAGIR